MRNFLIINLLSMLVSQSSSYKPGDPRFSELRLDLKSGRWTLHFWRWLQWLNSWFCWGFPTLGRLATSSARFSFNLSNLGTAGQSVEFQHMCYQLCIVVPPSPLSWNNWIYFFCRKNSTRLSSRWRPSIFWWKPSLWCVCVVSTSPEFYPPPG